MKYLFAGAVIAAAIGGFAHGQNPVEGEQAYSPLGQYVRVNPAVSLAMTDTQEFVTGDAPWLLRARRAGVIDANTLTIGGYFKAAQFFERTDTAGKFPILNRFPNQHGPGTRNDDFVVNAAGIAFTGTLGDWLTGYLQYEYSEVTFTGDQNQVQAREFYAVLGNLDVFGGYIAYGRKTIDFGEQTGYNPFTHTINQHFFWTLADSPVVELGYIGDDWRVSATLADGDRMLRTGQTLDRNGGLGSNFALKAERVFRFDEARALRISASYLHDTIYNNNFTAHTFQAINRFGPPNAPRPPRVYIAERVGLWDVAAEYTTPRYDLAVEYTQTTRPWVAVSYNNDTGQPLPGARELSALSIMGRYRTEVAGYDATLAAVLSGSILGPDGTEFDAVYQHVISGELHLNRFVDLGVELVLNEGWQPFVGIQDVADSSVQSQALLIGLTARF
ncbi:hypothetical protein GCM10007420_00590 [Glycocaulis albus]|jgi:hypothetical protein|uniref:Alginate export domain-containing protein n=1 Tax=Glycocaulis albus TaxID=1382801 RepID=A0ABQ1XC09_9PROT|nr:hypothetical protein [Glycocaulis albus]MBV5256855.1 hypothetical protein [Synechococcus moorigangaii CMS01]GGG89466.1 hypothetical protein GCM10007420_00590 [Glycocaulis albus]